jgi:rod shape-determining protein MreC
VVGPEGIVGIVHSVSENFASILPLLHSDSKISGRLKGKDYFGQCRWRGIDDHYVILENIPNHVSIAKGDTVITRGSRGIFPAGLIIGFAESSERDESSGFQEIKVKLATDFQKLNSLYIIVNQEKLELDSFLTKTVEWTD